MPTLASAKRLMGSTTSNLATAGKDEQVPAIFRYARDVFLLALYDSTLQKGASSASAVIHFNSAFFG